MYLVYLQRKIKLLVFADQLLVACLFPWLNCCKNWIVAKCAENPAYGYNFLANTFEVYCHSLQDKRAVERLNIDKVYHPFITGAYNKLVGEMMQETGARINIPPPSINKTEIVITGEKEQVAVAMAMIKKVYEEKVSVAQKARLISSN